MKRVVLLGGGHAHALLLLQWARRPTAGVQLCLVSPQPHSLYSGSVPGWLAGRWGAEALQIDLVSLCRAAGVRWLQGEAVALDTPAKQLQLASGEQLPFDLLSINTGSTLTPPAHPGPLLTLRPLHALVQAWPRWLADWRRGHGPANLDMVGGGAAGVEVLLAVLARLRALRPDRGISPRLFAASERLLPGHPAAVARLAQAELQAAGVELRLGQRWQPGDSAATAHLLWAPGAQPPTWLAQSPLMLSADGCVAVNACLQSRSHPHVFAAGDSAALDPPLEKSGVRAVRMAPLLARNLRAALAGEPLQPYHPQQAVLALLALPDGRAIASRAGWPALQGRWVGRWKEFLDGRFMRQFHPEALASLHPETP